MRTFDYIRLADQTWDMDILNLVAKIHEYKGRQDLYIRQKYTFTQKSGVSVIVYRKIEK